MDEIDLLTRHRPDPPTPTDAERAAIRVRIMDHVDPGGTLLPAPDADPAVEHRPADTAARRARRVPRILVAVTAAAIVLVAVLISRVGDDPVDRRETADGPTATETPADIGPYPTVPFSVEVAITTVATGGTEPRTVSGRVVIHRVDEEVSVGDTTACDGCDPTLLMLDLGDGPVEGSVADVRAAVEELLAERSDAPARLDALATALQQPAAGPVLRVQLLTALAELEGTEVQEGSRTATGAVGTRYLAQSSYGRVAIVVDPVDGYVLETASTTRPAEALDGESATTSIMTPAGHFSPDSALDTVVSYDRPVAEDTVPADVVALAATVRAGPQPGPGGCSSATGNDPTLGPGVRMETPVPPHLSFSYCPVD